MKRFVTISLVALSCLAIVFGQETYYRNDLSFTPKALVLSEPFTCVADRRSDIAFFDDVKNEKAFSGCTVEQEAKPHPLRITVLGTKADVTASTPFGLMHLWYQIVTQNDGMLVLGGEEATGHVTITIDLKRGAFVYTKAAWVGGQVHVTSLWGRCQND